MTLEEARKVGELFGIGPHSSTCSYCAHEFAEAAEAKFPEFVWVAKEDSSGPGIWIDVQEKVE